VARQVRAFFARNRELGMPQDLDRRNFLVSIAGGTAALASWGTPAVGFVVDSVSADSFRALTPAQGKLLEAITEQLVPADEFPGAGAVGVVSYIDGVLAGPYGKFYKSQYDHGLQAIEAYSLKQFQKGFVSLDPAQRADILSKFESGTADGESGQRIFNLILLQTFEGYYAHSHHGADGTNPSWKMIGFEG
jgi:Gluconate 2-dehydrogenase subunit 3